MTKRLRVLFIAVLISALAVVIYIVGQRIHWDRNHKEYTMAVKYQEIQKAHQAYGKEPRTLITDLKEKGLTGLMVTVDGFTQSNTPTPDQIRSISEDYNLEYLLEFRHLDFSSPEGMETARKWTTGLSPAAIIFHEESCQLDLSKISQWLKGKSSLIGALEFRGQQAPRQLAVGNGSKVVRVHRIFEEELPIGTLGALTARYTRAVKERNIGLIEYRLLTEFSWDQNLEGFSEVTSRLNELGYKTTKISQVKGARNPLSLTRWLLIPLALGITALVTLLISATFSTLRTSALASVIIPIGTAVSVWGLFNKPLLTRQALALLLATVAPAISYFVIRSYLKSRRPDSLPARAGASVKGLMLIVAVNTGFGLGISAILTDNPFIIKLYQFRGVKFSLTVPLVLVILIAFYKKDLSLSLSGFRPKLLAVVALAGGLLGFLLLRSGNLSLMPITDFEQAVRSWLERTLLARPRFKEFIIGHPLLLGWLYRRLEDKRDLYQLLLLLLGFLGQVSIINTFAHIHTPLMISLLRTVNGLALGLIGGLVLLLVIAGIQRAIRE